MIKIFLLFKELTFLFEKKMVFSAPEEDKDFKDITEVYNKTTELKPEDGYVYYYQCGIQSFNSKKYEDAIFFFTKVIEYKSDFARAYYYLGEIYKILKEYKKAIINWEKAIEINPEYLKKLDKFIKEIEGKNK